MDNDQCKAHGIIDSNICVSTLVDKSPATGDSGSPLILQSWSEFGSEPELIGLFSLAVHDQFNIGVPVVYTRVSSYLKWIKDATGIANY